MATPESSTFDPRFSDPTAGATSWQEAQQVIESSQLCWITTVRPDGRPHTVPLVAVWFDDTLYFCTGAEEQKAVNLAANPQVTVTIGSDRWDSGLDVIVEGTAVRATDHPLLERLAALWRTKWDGRWHYEVRDGAFDQLGGGPGGTALVFGVRPVKVLAFGKGTFSQTRHQFRGPVGSGSGVR